ncbi:ABC transporter ATP-binding protein [Heliophilum fasciatum]|uniref:Putative ABC transport system ATP-binding protein/lipoprotein-releasing system ATP-binding protein n=1 Tax=Heliophilum fasciatum TaxID=35700 RepID=A0A4R2REU1_9FIRM|nr:ABC transporter ATP-binding protein [Heliophilum fasciatum]MCW2278909.1 ABC-type lipoprotein export system ATPase subunit [Heliophilum fasciatum]TCP62042.1 putative ABC transport system ATP-binding protein/lipoprotein-releasing system ATP-binding protein [Heliophilum fasciatum]
MIELKAIGKTYGKRNKQRVVLAQVNLKIEAGEFVAVTGPSGSGKTTLLCIMGALLQPTSGEVYMDGQRVDSGLTENERASIRSEKIGFVFQFPALIPTLTVMENVLLPITLAGKALDDGGSWARQLLAQVGLSDREDSLPGTLSGGEQRRVAIARALIRRPKVLLADEPTGALDLDTGNKLMELLQNLCREAGLTLVVVTHDPTVASKANREVKLLGINQEYKQTI